MSYRDDILQIIHSSGLPVDVPMTFFWEFDPRVHVGTDDGLRSGEMEPDAAHQQVEACTQKEDRAR